MVAIFLNLEWLYAGSSISEQYCSRQSCGAHVPAVGRSRHHRLVPQTIEQSRFCLWEELPLPKLRHYQLNSDFSCVQ